jgi:hypothetical protein
MAGGQRNTSKFGLRLGFSPRRICAAHCQGLAASTELDAALQLAVLETISTFCPCDGQPEIIRPRGLRSSVDVIVDKWPFKWDCSGQLSPRITT